MIRDNYPLEIIKTIKEGGSACIHHVRDNNVEGSPEYAIKICHRPQYLDWKKMKEHFLRSVNMIRNERDGFKKAEGLAHVLQCHGSAITRDGSFCLILDLAQRDLTSYLDRYGYQFEQNYISADQMTQSLHIIEELMTAVRGIHYRKLMHRDISSHNVLLRWKKRMGKDYKGRDKDFGRYEVLVCDFGFCAPVEGNVLSDQVFTVFFTPPEMFGNATEYTYKGDIYSVGIIVYWILNNKLPFRRNEDFRNRTDFKAIKGVEGVNFLLSG